MDTNSWKPLPCPFCGSDDIGPFGTKTHWKPYCLMCGAQADGEEEWNHRASEDVATMQGRIADLAAQVADLRDALTAAEILLEGVSGWRDKYGHVIGGK